ncbi:DUF456 domain-containing protein [Ornithinimicrobium sediminis]|uniref:DUF456 domain-containing protein n=1 Tax=Ornithinimicrobium sediminis TaxID=2904603 RepID=UPI001E53F684|nr:DUF456 domain-containing protein [Ornithinimicrobium sediminis]MCE0488005.1 DUF456 domain-containing protein [Ornithinimicrobium sediminis]
MTFVVAVCAVVMAVGLLGIVVPVLPGLLLVWLSILAWALVESSTTGWVVLGLTSVLYAVGMVLEFLIPGQRMRRAGVRTSTLVVAVVVAIVMGVVIPFIGFLIGFPLGIYLVQRVRRSTHDHAWEATVHALKAVGLNIVIELATALLMISTWVLALVRTT